MQNQLLLLEDVDDLGRSGEIVTVKPGYARNFLLPQKKAIVADKHSLRLQVKLKEERAKRAQIDKEEAESLAEKINNVELLIEVKVDPEGHMYGSVSALDIARLFEKEGHTIDRKNVVLPQPIKKLGIYKLNLRLKEGVAAAFTLKVNSDIPLVAQEKEAPQNEIKSEDI